MVNSVLQQVTIAINEATSTALNLSGAAIVGVLMPAAWTSAALEFQVSVDGIAYYDLYDDANGVVQMLVTANKYHVRTSGELATPNYVKIRSANSSTHADVNQAAARTLGVLLRAI